MHYVKWAINLTVNTKFFKNTLFSILNKCLKKNKLNFSFAKFKEWVYIAEAAGS